MKKDIIKKKRKKQEGHKPYVVDDVKFEAITKDFGKGFALIDACKKNGVSTEAYYNYLKRNPKKNALHEKALYRKEELAYTSMDIGLVKDWHAAAWWLERTKPERFREKKEIELHDQPILIDDIMS
jgi:hypothetical protein